MNLIQRDTPALTLIAKKNIVTGLIILKHIKIHKIGLTLKKRFFTKNLFLFIYYT